MKKCVTVLMSLMAFVAFSVNAQTTKVKKLEIKDVQISTKLAADQYEVDGLTTSETTKTKWLAMTVYYELEIDKKAKYLEKLTMKWEGVLKSPVAKSKTVYNFNKTVSYAYLKEGRHIAVIFVSPRVIDALYDGDSDKFAENLHLKLSVKADKTVKIAGKSYVYLNDGEKSTKSSVAKYFGDEDAEQLKYVLLDKSESPWAVAQSNAFDMIVPAKSE